MRTLGACVAALALASCATPYGDMGLMGGVRATQITADTFQITARGNAYTDADTIQRFVIRKAAEQTVTSGYDLFAMGNSVDRTSVGFISTANVTGTGNQAFAFGNTTRLVKPGETVMIKAFKGPRPNPMPPGLYDAREVLAYLVPPPK